MVPEPTLTVSVNGVVPHLAARHADLPGFAADVEAWGADKIVLGEHLLQALNVDHPGAADVDLMMPFPEPFALLASIAAVTTRVRLTTGAVLAVTRPAVVLAKLAATVDVLSDGRFELGVAAGWYEPEFLAVGVPFEERFARLDETIAACRALWGPQPATFRGRWTTFEDMYCQPTPVMGARLPIWFGGFVSDRTARRVAGCEGWIVSEATRIDDISVGLERIARACGEQGRDPAQVGVRAGLPRRYVGVERQRAHPKEFVDRAWEQVERYLGVGVTDVSVPIAEYARNRDDAAVIVSGLAERLGARS